MLYSRSVHSGPQRLAALLVDLAERHGTLGKGGTLITIPLSQEESPASSARHGQQ
jgi:hypothetical protein